MVKVQSKLVAWRNAIFVAFVTLVSCSAFAQEPTPEPEPEVGDIVTDALTLFTSVKGFVVGVVAFICFLVILKLIRKK